MTWLCLLFIAARTVSISLIIWRLVFQNVQKKSLNVNCPKVLCGVHMCMCVRTHTHIIMLLLKETDLSHTHTRACKTHYVVFRDFSLSLSHTHTQLFPIHLFDNINSHFSARENHYSNLQYDKKRKKHIPHSIQCKHLHIT